jgi:hypothetical protein
VHAASFIRATTWCNIPEDSHLHTCCHDNLKSHPELISLHFHCMVKELVSVMMLGLPCCECVVCHCYRDQMLTGVIVLLTQPQISLPPPHLTTSPPYKRDQPECFKERCGSIYIRGSPPCLQFPVLPPNPLEYEQV